MIMEMNSERRFYDTTKKTQWLKNLSYKRIKHEFRAKNMTFVQHEKGRVINIMPFLRLQFNN